MARHTEREIAFQVLYSLFFTPADSMAGLMERFRSAASVRDEKGQKTDGRDPGAPAPEGFAWEIVRGVWSRGAEIDGIIAEVARRPLDRLGRTETVILRMGTFELLSAACDPEIALSEAVILANDFGDVPSRQFINGILFGIAQKLKVLA